MSKKLVVVVLVGLLMSLPIMALAGEKTIIKYCTAQEPGIDERIAEQFMQMYPNIQVDIEHIPASSMNEKIMLMIAAEETPNLLLDYLGRLGTWKHQNLLESLNGTLSEEDMEDFYPSVLDLFTIDGDLFGYPVMYWLISYAVNNTLLDRAGVEIPKDFTLDVWMQIAERVSNPPELYATCFFAKGRSGDYWMLLNFQIFGASLYQDGDHTKTTLNSEAGVRALEWMIDVVKKGFAPAGVAAIGDSEFLRMFWSGKTVMQGDTPGDTYLRWEKKSFDQGAIDYLPDWRVTETPHLKEIASPPLFVGPSGVVVFKEEDKAKREAAIELAKFITNAENSLPRVALGQFSARKSMPPYTAEEEYQFALRLVAENGMADLGLTSPHYIEVRNALYPELQVAFMGTKTAKQALDDFAEAVRKIWED